MSRTDSEFSCEVVRITSLEAHPNADRLELAKFSMESGPTAYTVVVGKGDFSVGALAVYVSIDAVVPLVGPESERWQFLAKRLDAAGKPFYRLRAARIRGVYSEGILVPNVHTATDGCPSHSYQFGADVTKEWRISQYAPGPKQSEGTPKGTQTGKTSSKSRRLRQIEALVPEYSVTNLRKVPFLFQDGEEVVVTEKIHGTNFRFGWVKVGRSWEFVVGSHRTIKSCHDSLWDRLLAFVRSPFKARRSSGGYYGDDLWSTMAEGESLGSRSWDYRGIIFYGEIYGLTESGKEIQKGFRYGCDDSKLRLFDAWNVANTAWNDRWFLMKAAADMQLEIVPELYRGPFQANRIQRLAEGPTTIHEGDTNQIREGVVVEALTGAGRKGKWVSEAYKLAQQEE